MNRELAIEVLQLEDGFSIEDIRAQYSKRSKSLARKHAATTSKALKEKYSEILLQFSLAKSCLIQDNPAKSNELSNTRTHRDKSKARVPLSANRKRKAYKNKRAREQSDFSRQYFQEDIQPDVSGRFVSTSPPTNTRRKKPKIVKREQVKSKAPILSSNVKKGTAFMSCTLVGLVALFSSTSEPNAFSQSIIEQHPVRHNYANPPDRISFTSNTKQEDIPLALRRVTDIQKTIQNNIYKKHQLNMIDIPEGSFYAGCMSGLNCSDDENPLHLVRVKTFRLSQHEITFEQWDACVYDLVCTHIPNDEGWGRGNRPVINVSFEDIQQQFIPWLNKFIGKGFRLPSEMEWEYAARAGSSTQYYWGNHVGNNLANCGGPGCGSEWDNLSSAPVGSFPSNGFGLNDMLGNVMEWTADCWNDSYNGAPETQAPWIEGKCSSRAVRGGAWNSHPLHIRVADRNAFYSHKRSNHRGFRVAQDLDPFYQTTHSSR